MHRHHLCKPTEAHRQVPSLGWQVDSETMSLAPTVVCTSVCVRGGSYLVHTDTHTCYVTPCSLQCDISHSANWSDSYTVITDFDVWQDKSNYSYSKPMLCLRCRSDPRGCSVFFSFLQPQPSADAGFCPTASTISTLCPGSEIDFCKISKCHFSTSPPPHLLFLHPPPLPMFLAVTLSHSPHYQSFQCLFSSVASFTSLIVAFFFPAIFFPPSLSLWC